MAGFSSDRYPEIIFLMLILMFILNIIILAVVSATVDKLNG